MSANCPGCGRFAHATSVVGWDGQQTQEWVTTTCQKCGERTVATV